MIGFIQTGLSQHRCTCMYLYVERVFFINCFVLIDVWSPLKSLKFEILQSIVDSINDSRGLPQTAARLL